jgi:hypothetical protein
VADVFGRSAQGAHDPEEYPGLVYPPGIRSMPELDEHNAKKQLDELLDHINKTYGIFCLTRSNDNIPMWTHYASDHQGLVIEFDAEHPFFKNSHDMYAVEYSKDRIALSSFDGCLRLAGHYYSPKSNYKDLPVRLFLRNLLAGRMKRK